MKYRLIVFASLTLGAGCATWSQGTAPNWSVPTPDSVGAAAPRGRAAAVPERRPAVAGRPYGGFRAMSPPPQVPTPSHLTQRGSGPAYLQQPPEIQAESRPFRLDGNNDSLLRRPFDPNTPAVDSNSAPRIPDPNALVPAGGTLAQSINEGWQVRGSGAPAVHHERTSAAASPAASSGWKTIGRSVHGRPIEARQFGAGGKRLFIVGSLAGNERDAVDLAGALAALLEREPNLISGLTVLVMRSPNPDGLLENTLTNGRGVVLNRNFPSRNFPGSRTAETGPTPASEPETQTLLALLDDLRPDRVVHLRSGNSSRMLLLAGGAPLPALRSAADRRWMDVGELEMWKAGSIEEYCRLQLESETLVLSLTADPAAWRDAVPQITRVLCTGLAHEPTASNPPDQHAAGDSTLAATLEQRRPARGVDDLFAPYQPPARRTGAVEAAPRPSSPAAFQPDGKKGYVEYLPPPPEFGDRQAGLDPKYYELVPPPGP